MKANTEQIPFARPSLGREEEEAVLRVLRSGWLTTGQEALAFEQEFKDFTGCSHALAVNSATSGLHLALEALGVGPGDKVLVPSYTFTASAEILHYLGADPVFVDLAEGSFNMDPRDCEKKIRTLLASGASLKGIIPVHIAGNPEFLEDHWKLSRNYNLFLLEDAAHCFPVPMKNGYAGCRGDAGVYSFYANKTITTGEGGMVVLDNPDRAKRICRMRLHGINRPVWNRYTEPEAPWEYDVTEAGYKYNMNDIAAALGRIQLKRAKSLLEKRKKLVKGYLELLEDAEFLKLPSWSDEHAWHLFIIRLNLDKLSIDRNTFIRELNARGIGCSVHYKPLHLMSYYKERHTLNCQDFPHATQTFNQVVSLPLYPDMERATLEKVCRCVLDTGRKFALKGSA